MRVMLVADRAPRGHDLVQALVGVPGVEVLTRAPRSGSLGGSARRLRPDVAVIALSSAAAALAAARTVRNQCEGAQVVLVGSEGHRRIRALAGAAVFVPADAPADELVRASLAAGYGLYHRYALEPETLLPRLAAGSPEQKIAAAAIAGATDHDIARSLDLQRTVVADVIRTLARALLTDASVEHPPGRATSGRRKRAPLDREAAPPPARRAG